jgi:hypothetical protein
MARLKTPAALLLPGEEIEIEINYNFSLKNV